MKKVIAWLLAAVMSVFLVACGAENRTSNSDESVDERTSPTENELTTSDTEPQLANGTEPQQTSATESQQTSDTEPLQTSAAEEPSASEPEASSAPAFDTGWAGDEYVMPIPEPPFTKFTVDYYGYKDYVQYYVYSTDESEVSALTEEDIAAYCKLLKNNGFTNITVELEYDQDNCMFRAFTEDEAIEVCVDCYIESGNIIIIYVKQNINS